MLNIIRMVIIWVKKVYRLSTENGHASQHDTMNGYYYNSMYCSNKYGNVTKPYDAPTLTHHANLHLNWGDREVGCWVSQTDSMPGDHFQLN